MKMLRWAVLILPIAVAALVVTGRQRSQVFVGSKTFTESVVLGEVLTQLARHAGAGVAHVAQLGGTSILFQALVNGEIDMYVEYTGTIREEILAGRKLRDSDAIEATLAKSGVRMSAPLGFNNTYAIGMLRPVAERFGLTRVSDLRARPSLRLAFSNEFIDRADGWPGLRDHYALPQTDVRGIDHDLAYPALESRAIDVTDLYTTDAKILKFDLAVLEDDRRHFPRYDAVILFRSDLEDRLPAITEAIKTLEGKISEQEMIAMNASVELDGFSESQAAAKFLAGELNVQADRQVSSVGADILKHTREHLRLVLLSLAAAVMVAIPLGIWASARPAAGHVILGVVGIVQTIPSLALLVMLMKPLSALGSAFPWLANVGVSGIGEAPAIVALFFYSLLPIVRNTCVGLQGVDPEIRESADAMGLPFGARLRLVDLPLAARAIIAGIKTAAVMNIGFATLGAIIGAGGYGQPILTGIRLNDFALILQGAGPAAGLAILAQIWFELVERAVVPKGLRLERS
ncbi:MAG: ABC transporter permease subunit [Planctomycetes bacterium]|nr:ABC transporter permease subunit [Planctomycetota bacterium]